MPLCTRSEVYIRLVCPGIGLSQGAADDARRQGAGLSLNTQLVVSLLSKGLWVGLTLLVRNTLAYASVLQAASLEFAGAFTQRIATPGPLGCRETRPKTSLCIIQQRLTDDHNSTNELQPILLNFLLPCT